MNVGFHSLFHDSDRSSYSRPVDCLWKLWDTRQKSKHGMNDALASAKAGTHSSHEGLLSKPLNRRHLDRFSTSPKPLRLLLVLLLLYLI
jgi:hypothetical protein